MDTKERLVLAQFDEKMHKAMDAFIQYMEQETDGTKKAALGIIGYALSMNMADLFGDLAQLEAKRRAGTENLVN